MAKTVLVFVLLWIFAYGVIEALRYSTNKARLSVLKMLVYSSAIAALVVGIMSLIVVLF